MDAEEREICDFLKSWQGQFVSGREICRRAGGKWRFREDDKWAIPVLTRLVDKGILECDPGGHFRIRRREQKDKKKVWLSPELRALLEKTGKSFAEGAELQDLGDPEE
jgi:hypothetical protein